MSNGPVRVTTVNDEVYARLRTWITSGRLTPGLRLSIRAVADALGVSTMPVREALRMLQAEGLVAFERRSVSVTRLSADEVAQAFAIRLRLEQLAAEWALPRITDEDVAALRALLTDMDDAHLDPARWRQSNRRFHERFYACAGSAHLIGLLRNVGDRIEPYMSIYASTVDDFAEAHRQHLRMLALIEARDLPGLLEETAWHLEHTSHTVADALTTAASSPQDPSSAAGATTHLSPQHRRPQPVHHPESR